METLGGKLGNIIEKLGQIFLIAGYFPAMLFVIMHQLFLFPHWLGQPLSLLQSGSDTATSADSGWIYLVDQAVTLLLLPLLLGILLMSFNTAIIRLYEGSYRWQQRSILQPRLRHNQRRVEELYGELVVIKEAYTKTLADLMVLPTEANRLPLEQKRISLEREIDRLHNEISKYAPLQRLPRRSSMVKPTALGNAFAVIEEYPYERYGMDGVLFWPRLRPLLDAPYVTMLVNTKMVLDLLLNISLLALIFGLEAIIAGIWNLFDWRSIRAFFTGSGIRLDWLLIGTGIGAWILAYGCYYSAVSAVYSLGDTIALCFDLHRGKLWEQFGFPPAKSLEEEQATWLRLGEFLRRGEGFYYPQIAADPIGLSAEVDYRPEA